MQAWQSAPAIGGQAQGQPARPTQQPAPQQMPNRIYGAPEAPKEAPQPTPVRPYDVQQDLVGNEQSLRKEFYSLPAVKEYQVAARTYANSLQAGSDASGDQSLIVAYAKMLDPASVVREGEAASVAGTDSTIGRNIARLQKELGLDGGGALSPDVRAKIRREMRTLAENYGASYGQERKQFEGLAASYGFDPTRVVGQDILDPYRQTIDEYWAAQDKAATQPKQPTARDEMPYGGKLALDGGGDDPFDRTRYLQERFGIDPGQESRLVGMFNANLGNPNVTPEMVAGFYEAAGLGQKDPTSPEIQRMANDLKSGKFAPTTGINVDAARQSYIDGLDTIIQRAGFNPENQGATLANTSRQGAAFEGFDEITGVVNAVAETLQGNNPIDGYRTGRDVTRRMVERGDAANPWTGVAGRVVGGLPTGVVGSAGGVNSLGAAARVGAIEGGITGFNAGEGAQNSLLGAGLGAPLGAGVGVAFQAGGNKIQSALRSNKTPVDGSQVQEVMDAGTRRNVTVRRPDVDPNVRQQRANVQQTEQGRSAIAAADAEDIGQIETALVRDLGGRPGTQRTEAASSVQTGVKAARDKLRADAQIEYRAASAEAGNISAPPTNAVAMLDQQIAELGAQGRNLNSKELSYLEGLKADLGQGGGLSIDALRAQRTGLRQKLENAGVYSGDFERRVGMVLDEAGKDVEAALQPFPGALARYQKADGLWRQQADFGKKVGDLLLGKDGNLSPGQAADRIMGWAKKDPARLNRLLTEADDATKEEVRALVASQIGRQNNGNFSLAAFLTQTSGGKGGALSPAAVRSLFGKEGQQAINDLRILSQAKVDAGSATNRSNTGGIVQGAKTGLRRMILGMIGFGSSAEPMTGALFGSASVVGGEFVEKLGRERALRLLLNPDFTGWLKTLPQTSNPAAINRRFASLRSTATRSPVMMADIQAFERMLVGTANDNASRVAAEPERTDEAGRGQQ